MGYSAGRRFWTVFDYSQLRVPLYVSFLPSFVCYYDLSSNPSYMEKSKNNYKSIIYYWEGKQSNRKAFISYSFTIRKQLERKMIDLQCDSPAEVSYLPLSSPSVTLFIKQLCS